MGIFFSDSLNREDYNRTNACLLGQFFTISVYRNKLIEFFTSDIEPFPISDTLVSRIRQTRDKESLKDVELKKIRDLIQKQARIFEELRMARRNNKRDTTEIIDQLMATNLRMCEEDACLRAHHQ
ncbi:unnamed protein product [Rotaria sp. Silwood1]|nr:unnamed protein product [Rotaria sp. Silwood1]CAF3801752.1 unnamed protein product [Rotaria sp. Silwood1]CAF4961443.1 unnamed protein product [Rotaria sp. Silwood1]CAF4998038.1 unnamed protein product [Rotaria sp. Silwood1]